MAYLLSRGAAVNAVNDRGDSSLHIAAYRGLLRVCSLLLQAGAVGGATTTKHGYTPLMLAAYKVEQKGASPTSNLHSDQSKG